VVVHLTDVVNVVQKYVKRLFASHAEPSLSDSPVGQQAELNESSPREGLNRAVSKPRIQQFGPAEQDRKYPHTSQ